MANNTQSNQLWSNSTTQYPLSPSSQPFVAFINRRNTFTQPQIIDSTLQVGQFNNGQLIVAANNAMSSISIIPKVSGTVNTVLVNQTSGTNGNLTLPAESVSDQLVARHTTDTLTNKTLTSPVVGNFLVGTQTNLSYQVATNQDTGIRIVRQSFSGPTNGLANIIQTFLFTQVGGFSIDITINCLCTSGVHAGAAASFKYLYWGTFQGGNVTTRATPLIAQTGMDAALTGIAVTLFTASNQLQVQSVGLAPDVIQWTGTISIYQ
jgi:hypothetical protein